MTTRVAVLSANLGVGGYDTPHSWPELQAPEGVTVETYRLDERHLPPRPLAMTSRLQCGIPKMFPWEFATADCYLWIDASCVPTPMAVPWFLEQLGNHEIAVFRHPDRKTIREEVTFMLERMRRPGERYLNSRYRGEWIDSLYATRPRDYRDDALYASTAFICRPTISIKLAFEAWFLSKVKFCLHDQIAWPWILRTHGVDVRVIEQSYLHCPALEYVRNKRR